MNFIRNFRDLSIGRKLVLVQAAAIILMIAILALSAGLIIKKQFTGRSYEQLNNLNGRVIDMITVYNAKLDEQARTLAKVFNRYGTNGKGELFIPQERIDHFTEITGAVATVFLRSGEDFRRVATSLKKENGARAVGTLLARDHPGYKKVLAGESYTGPAVLFGRNYMTHYEPVKNNGEVIGIHFIGVDFTEGARDLMERIRSVKIGREGYIYVLSDSGGREPGKCLVHRSPDFEGKQMIDLKDADGAPFIREMLKQGNGVISYNWKETGKFKDKKMKKIAAFSTYKEWNWIIVSGTYEEELISDGYLLRNYLSIILAVCLIAMLILISVSIRKIILVRVRKLTVLLGNISGGEGDLTMRLDFKGGDEIGEIARMFNRFIEDLEIMIADIIIVCRKLESTVKSIRDGNIDLSKRTTEQSATIEQITSRLEEATGVIGRSAESAGEAKKITEEGSAKASEGNEKAGKAIEAINDISSSSKKIEESVSVINELAFQTNLLALNAAVEAARAGEQGRGFAVVAGEVRNLAQRSAAAARDIADTISESVLRVDHGTHMVKETGESLNEIAGSAKFSASLISEINAASEEQKYSIIEVNKAVSTLEQMNQQNAGLVEETAALSGEMADRTTELMKLISKFKISG